jgi:hypothetical protein
MAAVTWRDAPAWPDCLLHLGEIGSHATLASRVGSGGVVHRQGIAGPEEQLVTSQTRQDPSKAARIRAS